MIQDIIKDIRKQCRLAMNGVTSTSMRQKGLSYKINFGLSFQQIKDLAQRYEPNAELAETIWREDTRELKILATLLYPLPEFTKEVADRWVSEIPNQEIREQICFNLFQNLLFANELVSLWGDDDKEEIRTTGYWLLARLSVQKLLGSVKSDDFRYLLVDVATDNISLRNAATLALKHIGRQSKDEADAILKKLSIEIKDDLIEQEVYDSLDFEFSYYFDN